VLSAENAHWSQISPTGGVLGFRRHRSTGNGEQTPAPAESRRRGSWHSNRKGDGNDNG
jgi:hypothetical protein